LKYDLPFKFLGFRVEIIYLSNNLNVLMFLFCTAKDRNSADLPPGFWGPTSESLRGVVLVLNMLSMAHLFHFSAVVLIGC
jgi:hypothetical protein